VGRPLVKIKVGLVQHEVADTVVENIEKVSVLAEEAVAQGASLVAFQELFHTRYFPMAPTSNQYFERAEPTEGQIVSAMRSLAVRLEVHMVVPFFEAAPGHRYFNSSVLMDPHGDLVGLYRKSHIPRLHREGRANSEIDEKYYFEPSALGYPSFPTSLGNIGMLICHDRHFPEAARVLALEGADVIVVPTASLGLPGSDSANDIWLTGLKAIAITNSVFVCGINRVGTERGETFLGHSCLVGPDGDVVVEADGAERAVVAELDFRRLDAARQSRQFVRDRRPDTYGALFR
jgi:N-carbamoylputrescine amidase